MFQFVLLLFGCTYFALLLADHYITRRHLLNISFKHSVWVNLLSSASSLASFFLLGRPLNHLFFLAAHTFWPSYSYLRLRMDLFEVFVGFEIFFAIVITGGIVKYLCYRSIVKRYGKKLLLVCMAANLMAYIAFVILPIAYQLLRRKWNM